MFDDYDDDEDDDGDSLIIVGDCNDDKDDGYNKCLG